MAQRDRNVQADQAARLREEVGLLRRQYDDAKRNYDSEVVRHGDALKRYAGGARAGRAGHCWVRPGVGVCNWSLASHLCVTPVCR